MGVHVGVSGIAGACIAAVMGIGLFSVGGSYTLPGHSASLAFADGVSATQADAEASLRAELEAAGCSLLYFWCADYDHDGSYEAFAIDGTLENPFEEGGESDGGIAHGNLWFTAGPGTTKIVDDASLAHPTIQPSGLQSGTDHDFLSIFIYGHGSGGRVTTYTVYNREPIAVDLSSDLSWLSQDGRGQVEQGAQDSTEPKSYSMPDCAQASSLEEFASWLDTADRAVEYDYVAAAFTAEPNFKWVVDDDLADGTPVGSCIKDFDNDGQTELLVAMWRNKTVALDMYELVDGSVVLAASSPDTCVPGFPDKGIGLLDVLCGADGALYLQWWYHTSPVADGHEWAVERLDYDENSFTLTGTACVVGTGGVPLDDLRAVMAAIGLDASVVPDEGSSFMREPLVEHDSSLTLISRATAWIDDDFNASAMNQTRSKLNGDQTVTGRLGTFRIGPTVSSQDEQSSAASTPTYTDVPASAGQVSTKEGVVAYSYYWDSNVPVATSDGGFRTLHSFYITNLSYSPADAAAGQYVEGFILTSGNHCIHWSGQATGGSIAIDNLWYTDQDGSYNVTTTSYDAGGFHWFGHDSATGDFRIS